MKSKRTPFITTALVFGVTGLSTGCNNNEEDYTSNPPCLDWVDCDTGDTGDTGEDTDDSDDESE